MGPAEIEDVHASNVESGPGSHAVLKRMARRAHGFVASDLKQVPTIYDLLCESSRRAKYHKNQMFDQKYQIFVVTCPRTA